MNLVRRTAGDSVFEYSPASDDQIWTFENVTVVNGPRPVIKAAAATIFARNWTVSDHARTSTEPVVSAINSNARNIVLDSVVITTPGYPLLALTSAAVGALPFSV